MPCLRLELAASLAQDSATGGGREVRRARCNLDTAALEILNADV